MGNLLCCRPLTTVTEDPNVIMHTEVGFSALKGRYPDDFSVLSRWGGGVAYVRNTGYLFLGSTVGGRLCCFGCSEGWRSSDISQVEAVSGTVAYSRHTNSGSFDFTNQMNPGLRIMLASGDRMWIKMSDAVNFCARLRQQCNLPTINPSVVPIGDMEWRDILGHHLVSTHSSVREETEPLLPKDRQALISPSSHA